MTPEEECWARAVYDAEARLSRNNRIDWTDQVKERYLELAKAAREAKYEDPIETLAKEVREISQRAPHQGYAIARRMYELGARPPKGT